MRARTRMGGVLALVVLSLAGCTSWKRFAYEGVDRDEWQQPARVIAALEVQPGDRIADLGAGSGYFTFRLAEAVGPEGIIYAVDVDPDMTALIEETAKTRHVDNVRVVLAAPDDPRLPDGEIDLVFTSNTYHHIEDPRAYFSRLQKDLAPQGRVAVLEYRPDASWFTRLFGHATSDEDIRADMEAAGYQLDAEPTIVDRQSFLIFSKS